MAPCPYCRKPNQPSTTFCIHCGEPTDSLSVREYALSPQRLSPAESEEIKSRGPAFRRRFAIFDLLSNGRTLELTLGLGIIIAVVLFSVVSSVRQEEQSTHYRLGVEAESKREYETALAELAQAIGYRDAGERHKEIEAKLETRARLYEEAVYASYAGNWWKVAKFLNGVSEIDPKYEATASLLQTARKANGLITYRLAPWADGDGGIYVAYADGSAARRIPGTDVLSLVRAVSPDGLWIVFSSYERQQGRKNLLYNVSQHKVLDITLPVPTNNQIVTARFSPDSTLAWVDVSGQTFTFHMPDPETQRNHIHSEEERGRPAIGVADNMSPAFVDVQYDESTRTSSIFVSNSPGLPAGLIAISKGRVDGVLFSPDSNYLLYRLCTEPNASGSFTCEIFLVDLRKREPAQVSLGSIPILSRDLQRWALNAEFTRDGQHVLLLQNYGGETVLHIYALETGEFSELKTGFTPEVIDALRRGPLFAVAVPGLGSWKGSNSLAYTRRTVELPEEQGVRVPRYYARSHWFAVSPNHEHVTFLTGHDINEVRGEYTLWSAPVAGASTEKAAPSLLIKAERRPGLWLPLMYMLPDGHTLITTEPPEPNMTRGLYAYDLGTGEHTLALRDASELWRPGYSSLVPELPRFLGR